MLCDAYVGVCVCQEAHSAANTAASRAIQPQDQGALNAHPVLPTMVRARNGVDVSMKKAGGFMLTVAPAAMVR